jgi:aldose 1-epimerase
VTYSLSDDNGLKIEYWAKSDKDTVVNLTNHAYFNLSGNASGEILGHELVLNASRFTPINENMIPTGELRDVAGTPMDFTKPTPVGLRISEKDEQLDFGGGYDHNWVLDSSGILPGKAAELYDPNSGRVMEVYTTKPGIQLYSGNFLNGSKKFKNGAAYGKRGGLCLETQYFPDSVNQPHFPSSLLKAGHEYKHMTIYKFRCSK